MFRRVLIANRGEIAVRIARALQQMDITAVAIHSQADAQSLHVACADEAYGLEGFTSAETYLNAERILDIARAHRIDAIHPGYGFLSENASFARACRDRGIVFIGPAPEVIHAMGDKIRARSIMDKAGVPVVPGWSAPLTAIRENSQAGSCEDSLIAERAGEIGFPVMIKAASGGGGRGMRVAYSPHDLPSAVQSARREAASAFGDTRLFLEKYISPARHIEFQIFGDAHGNMVHLFERECSIQRRHQKIVEESPAPGLSASLRGRMADAAIRVAKALGYSNAGTVEFILGPGDQFYFLEVNTRLQVEHPVTEMVTRQDLVRAQLLVASGMALPFDQESLSQSGHAIECRIYAEDPQNNFLPATGTINHYEPPSGPDIRLDSGIRTGTVISTYYDPMLAKLITWSQDRSSAISKLSWGLRHCVLLGVPTNIEYLNRLVTHEAFRRGDLHTQFLEEHAQVLHETRSGAMDQCERVDEGETPDGIPYEAFVAAAWACQNDTSQRGSHTADAATTDHDPWKQAGSWRGA